MRRSFALVVVLAACTDRTVAFTPPSTGGEHTAIIPLETDLDLLFVIDNSASTGDKQAAFRRSFGDFIAELDRFPTGRPNVHIAVVDTTVDLGTNAFAGCPSPDPADNGLFQTGAGCGVNGRFLVDVTTPDGRDTNYAGDLATAFTCIASVGDRGCGFEAPLEAMKRALDGTRPENFGFRRNHAPLVIVILSDEDDASVRDPAVFALSGSQDDFRLQPLYAYACDQPISDTSPGRYTGCHTRTDSYLRAPAYYADFLATVKAPNQTLIAVIASPPPGLATDDVPAQQANINTDAIATGPLAIAGGSQPLALLPSTSCTVEGQAAIGRPAVRLADFVSQFGARGRFYNVCQADYSAVLANLSSTVDQFLPLCLDGQLALPLDCSVADVQNRGTSAQSEQVIPPCTDAGTQPCWSARVDPELCPAAATHSVIHVDRASPPPSGTETVVTCALAPA